MDEEGIVYLLFSLVIILIGFNISPMFGGGLYSAIALILLAVTAVVIIAMNWADFVIVPAITSLLGISFQPAKGYKINKNQSAVIKNVNGLYYSTAYITANLFGYTFRTEDVQDDEYKLIAAPETWERIVMNLNFPFKYHILATGLDVQVVRDELEGKRSYQEFQLSRALQGNSNEVVLTDIRRKLSSIQAKIDRISQGERPIGAVMYIETTAIGVSEKASIDALEAQVKQLQVSFSALDIELRRVVGREIYTLFKFNYALPTTFAELAMNFDQQS